MLAFQGLITRGMNVLGRRLRGMGNVLLWFIGAAVAFMFWGTVAYGILVFISL